MSPEGQPGRLKIPIRSRRRRRRVVMLGVFTLVAGSVAGIIVIVGNTGKRLPEHVTKGPAQVYREPARHRLTKSERNEVRRVTLVFIGSAVARKHLDDSYDLVAPDLREGLTKAEWRTGNIPVVPYPAQAIIRWTLEYSFENDVAYEVVLAGKPGTLPKGKTFFIELRRFPRVRPDWLVESWTPTGISNDTPQEVRRATSPPPVAKAGLSAIWLLVPAGILALLVVVPLVVFSRHWYIGRRARARMASQR